MNKHASKLVILEKIYQYVFNVRKYGKYYKISLIFIRCIALMILGQIFQHQNYYSIFFNMQGWINQNDLIFNYK